MLFKFSNSYCIFISYSVYTNNPLVKLMKKKNDAVREGAKYILATRPQGKMTSSGGEENNVCLWGRYRGTIHALDTSNNILMLGVE